MFSCGVFIDLQKAFDTVNHSIPLHKLSHYGIRGTVNDWFSSYLSNRIQTTQVGSHVSRKESTLCGVPQGSVLGPLLFQGPLLKIQALPFVTLQTVDSYADTSTLISEIKKAS